MSLPKVNFKNLPQKGFAMIPLIVLLLVGITAGTLLIQNGTSFLPKAQEEWNPGNDNVFRIRFEEYCYNNSAGERVRKYHIKQGNNLIESKEAACDNASRPCGDFMKQFCGIREMVCAKNSPFQATCTPFTGNKNTVYGCTLDQAKSQKLTMNQCQLLDNASVKIYGGESCLNTETPDKYVYFCDQEPAAAQPPATAPAAAPAQPAPAGQAPGISATSCSDEQKLSCEKESWQPKGGCVITVGERKQCKYEPSREGDLCNRDPAHPETGAVCGSMECRVIDGLTRCITSTCTPEDNTFCRSKGATCEVGTKKIGGVDKNYTYCKPGSSSAAAPAANAPARTSSAANSTATAPRTGTQSQGSGTQTSSGKPGITTTKCTSAQLSNTGCTSTPDRCIVDFAGKGWCKYPDSEEGKACNNTHKTACGSAECKVINGLPRCKATTCTTQDNTACGANSTCATGSEQGFSYTYCGPKGGSSTPGNSANQVRSDMTNADCGYTDADGLPIPCYKVGVFNSADELQATQEQARLATTRYLQSQEILTAVKGKINDQVAAKAQEKLNAAKAAADACMKQ